MNWRLLFTLSLFGIAMGVATVAALIPRGAEGVVWVLIGIFCAYWIPRKTRTRRIRHSFIIGVAAGLAAPLVQVLFLDTYLANNPEAAAMFIQAENETGVAAASVILTTAPFIAVLSGLVLSGMTWVAVKLYRERPVADPPGTQTR